MDRSVGRCVGLVLTMVTLLWAAGCGSTGGSPAERSTFVYVANVDGNSVSQYRQNADGTLSPLSPAAVSSGGTRPFSLAASPDGRFVYAVNQSGTVTPYAVGTDGTLSALQAVTLPAFADPNVMVIEPSGKYAYVGGYKDLYQFSVNADGTLSALQPVSVPGGQLPLTMSVAKGAYLYVGYMNSHEILQYSIGANGTLTPLSPPKLSTPITTTSILNPATMNVSPDGKYVYVASSYGEPHKALLQYRVQPDGTLAPLSPEAATIPHTYPVALKLDPAGQAGYYVDSDANILSRALVNPDGTLTSTTTAVATGAAPASVTVDASGRFIYVANFSGSVSQYQANPDGTITSLGPGVATGQGANWIIAIQR